MYRIFFKPILDFIFSLLAILILSPLILVLLLSVYICLGSPVFFCQERPGKNEKIFTLFKFRTMTMEHSQVGELLPDKDRLTSFGKFLRKTILDELPQLFNVIIGNLSLVGPRPLLTEYLPFYNDEQKARHKVKPGLTGWAQVNGRNAITWEDKFKLDIFYVDNISFILDIKILFKTMIKTIKGSDINSNDGFTMDKFQGSKL